VIDTFDSQGVVIWGHSVHALMLTPRYFNYMYEMCSYLRGNQGQIFPKASFLSYNCRGFTTEKSSATAKFFFDGTGV
jgi:hypothetical protein